MRGPCSPWIAAFTLALVAGAAGPALGSRPHAPGPRPHAPAARGAPPAKTFAITPEVRVSVTVGETFSLCFLSARTGEEILCTASEGALEAGEWVGLNLQKYFYEGYSLRVGRVVWQTKSLDVQTDSIVYEAREAGQGGRGEPGPGPGGTLRFQVVLEEREIASVEVKRASADHDAAVAVSVKTRVGNRLKLHAAPRDEAGRREGLFGLGERFASVDQRGKSLYCWCEDGGWSLGPFKRLPKGKETTYMPVPFLLSSAGHGVWLNTTRRTDWDLDSAGDGRYSLQVEGRELDLVLISGGTPARSLEVFTALTGRALIPPKFQFGPWNNFFNELGRDMSAQQQARKFVDLDIPSSVTDYAIHFLPDGKGIFPEGLRQATAGLRSLGISPLAYFNSMIDEEYEPVYSLARAAGLFVKSRWGTPWSFYYKGANYEPFKVGLLDFTNPAARDLFASLLDNSTAMGFKGFMYDYGEYVDPDMRFHDGTTGEVSHNAYPLQYQSVAFDYFAGLRPGPPGPGGGGAAARAGPGFGDGDYAPDYVFYARSGYTGMAGKTWAAWTGDPTCDWDRSTGLPAQVKGMLNAGLSGVPFVGSDIGGFVWVEPPSLELWVRWVQVGAASGIMRMQTGGTSLVGKRKSHIHDSLLGTALYRRYAKLRTSLFPYLYSAAHAARARGLPVMRHHLLQSWWRDEDALKQEYQYMLGPSLLCAPVVNRGQEKQRVYLPSGSAWYDLGTPMAYDESDGRHRVGSLGPEEGGRFLEVEAPLDRLPMFARAGSAVPTLTPEVDTLNEATDPAVTTMAEVEGTLNWWVFPDSNATARGSTWDGAQLAMEGDGTLLLEDLKGRSWLLQVARFDAAGQWPPRGVGPRLERFRTWEEVVDCDTARGGWAVDPLQQTLWIKANTASVSRLALLL